MPQLEGRPQTGCFGFMSNSEGYHDNLSLCGCQDNITEIMRNNTLDTTNTCLNMTSSIFGTEYTTRTLLVGNKTNEC